jgi:hypothetical protein
MGRIHRLCYVALLVTAFSALAADNTSPHKPYDGWIIGPHRVEVEHGLRVISAYALRDGERHDMKSEHEMTLSCAVENPRCHTPAIWQVYVMLGADGPYKCDDYSLIRVVDEKSDPIKVDVDEQMSVCLDSVK